MTGAPSPRESAGSARLLGNEEGGLQMARLGPVHAIGSLTVSVGGGGTEVALAL